MSDQQTRDHNPGTARHHYLFALVDGGGTVPPELGVARRLLDRGHRVNVLADNSMAGEVAGTGAAFTPWTESWGQFEDWELRTPRSQLRGVVDHMFVGPAAGQARDAAAAIEYLRPDLVLTSLPAMGAMIAAESHRIPFGVMFPNVYALPAPGMPPFGAGLPPARGRIGRFRDSVAGSMSMALFDRYALARINALRAEYGLVPLAHSWDQMHQAWRELVLTSAAFDFPARLPDNVRYTGPILDDPAWAVSDSWTLPDGDQPLVLVALSSTFQNQTGCLQRIVDALGSLPVRGLVTTGPAIRPEAVRAPANVAVVSSAPHHQVMPQASLVVTHGGHGTVMKSLVAGVPMVILPHGRDQADNAVRVSMRGAGLAVSRRASAKRIARAISKVLGGDGYRHAATELGRMIARDAVTGTLLTEIENLPARAD
ncbi:glycosyltransferase [Arthrobacter sp. zg-ZUI100]|uniref:glycosyltransferase n=1 Tax=Arthrobacter jiangjiafuii TaxID=2817475 RepID=UPI001AEEB9F1|nr:nucleotide disphospho-sugar-binding domain-containing protein [Arthrobacter jiangjiafuii]MBP3036040.1 glycosyltransferase [Arthrobacter jiangjiafuii]